MSSSRSRLSRPGRPADHDRPRESESTSRTAAMDAAPPRSTKNHATRRRAGDEPLRSWTNMNATCRARAMVPRNLNIHNDRVNKRHNTIATKGQQRRLCRAALQHMDETVGQTHAAAQAGAAFAASEAPLKMGRAGVPRCNEALRRRIAWLRRGQQPCMPQASELALDACARVPGERGAPRPSAAEPRRASARSPARIATSSTSTGEALLVARGLPVLVRKTRLVTHLRMSGRAPARLFRDPRGREHLREHGRPDVHDNNHEGYPSAPYGSSEYPSIIRSGSNRRYSIMHSRGHRSLRTRATRATHVVTDSIHSHIPRPSPVRAPTRGPSGSVLGPSKLHEPLILAHGGPRANSCSGSPPAGPVEGQRIPSHRAGRGRPRSAQQHALRLSAPPVQSTRTSRSAVVAARRRRSRHRGCSTYGSSARRRGRRARIAHFVRIASCARLVLEDRAQRI